MRDQHRGSIEQEQYWNIVTDMEYQIRLKDTKTLTFNLIFYK